jgi:hypothetical protein
MKGFKTSWTALLFCLYFPLLKSCQSNLNVTLMLQIKYNVQSWLKFHPSTAKHTNLLVFSQQNIIFNFEWTMNLLPQDFFCSSSKK